MGFHVWDGGNLADLPVVCSPRNDLQFALLAQPSKRRPADFEPVSPAHDEWALLCELASACRWCSTRLCRFAGSLGLAGMVVGALSCRRPERAAIVQVGGLRQQISWYGSDLEGSASGGPFRPLHEPLFNASGDFDVLTYRSGNCCRNGSVMSDRCGQASAYLHAARAGYGDFFATSEVSVQRFSIVARSAYCHSPMGALRCCPG